MSILLFLGLISCNPGGQKQEKAAGIPDWAVTARTQVEQWVENGSVVGAGLLIIQDGKVILQEAYGMNDAERGIPLQKNQIHKIHSMTKPFTGTAILMLMEEGMLDLDDPVSDYLEAFRNDECREITIRQLLDHTAGFVQPAYPRGSIDLYADLEEAVTDLAAHGPEHNPGTAYHYSDGHSATLGMIVTKRSGMPVEEFIAERIFEPLGMRDSYCLLKPGQPDRSRVCNTYRWTEDGYVKAWDQGDEPETPFFRASGGIYTTPGDYARFLGLIMNGGSNGQVRLLKASTLREALSPGSLNDAYGLHWELLHHFEDTAILPVFGHGGSAGTQAMALPEQNAMVFYFSQSRGTLTSEFFKEMILQELGYKEKKHFSTRPPDEWLYESYTGEYRISGRPWTVERTQQGICLKSGRLVPIDFRPVSDSVFEQPYMDWSVTFHRNAEGFADNFSFRLGERIVEAIRE
ncbi:MAG: serine hydrolase domain-containing protein [Bacteroidales bacterium]